MPSLPTVSRADQCHAALREAMRSGRLQGRMPPSRRLALELGVSPHTLKIALRRLANEGLITLTPRRAPLILAQEKTPHTGLRIGVYLATEYDRAPSVIRRLLTAARAEWEHAGHTCLIVSDLAVGEIAPSPARLRELTEAEVDARIVVGASGATLDHLGALPAPVLAIAGRSLGRDIAALGTDIEQAFRDALRDLLESGHHRIVLISPRTWRQPDESPRLAQFRSELARHGIRAGTYHLPDWDESPAHLRKLLGDLFRLTLPTALIFTTFEPALTAMGFAMTRGLAFPRDFSLLVMEEDPSFAWLHPCPAHFAKPENKLLRHLLDWVGQVSRGHPDKRHRTVRARLVPAQGFALPPFTR